MALREKYPRLVICDIMGYGDGETLVIAIQNEREWGQFCREILERSDMVDDPKFNSNSGRVTKRPIITAHDEHQFRPGLGWAYGPDSGGVYG